MELLDCRACRGLVPPTRATCPHCDAAIRPQRGGALARALIRVLTGSATAMTLSACYGITAQELPDGGQACYESDYDADDDGWLDCNAAWYDGCFAYETECDCDDWDPTIMTCDDRIGITVDPTQRFQTWEGWTAALRRFDAPTFVYNDSAVGPPIERVPVEAREQILDAIYTARAFDGIEVTLAAPLDPMIAQPEPAGWLPHEAAANDDADPSTITWEGLDFSYWEPLLALAAGAEDRITARGREPLITLRVGAGPAWRWGDTAESAEWVAIAVLHLREAGLGIDRVVIGDVGGVVAEEVAAATGALLTAAGLVDVTTLAQPASIDGYALWLDPRSAIIDAFTSIVDHGAVTHTAEPVRLWFDANDMWHYQSFDGWPWSDLSAIVENITPGQVRVAATSSDPAVRVIAFLDDTEELADLVLLDEAPYRVAVTLPDGSLLALEPGVPTFVEAPLPLP